MLGTTAIKGVLLDVGDTLTTPRGGRWNPRFDFSRIIEVFSDVVPALSAMKE